MWKPSSYGEGKTENVSSNPCCVSFALGCMFKHSYNTDLCTLNTACNAQLDLHPRESHTDHAISHVETVTLDPTSIQCHQNLFQVHIL